MFLRLVLLFTLIPLIELYILMKLGAHFGVGITLVVVIGTGILGAYLARREGYRIVGRIQSEIRLGRMPAEYMIEGLLIFIAGIVLLTPGVLTDILGFLILLPATRVVVRKWIVEKIRAALERSQYTNIHYHVE